MNWKMILLGLLTVCLLAGGSTAVLAQSSDQPGLEPEIATLGQADDEFEIGNGISILPDSAPGEKLAINGGFTGVWEEVYETDQVIERPGQLAGLYGTVTKEDGTVYGFMGGVYTKGNGELGGFLLGKYADGAFWGNWLSATSEANGQFGGTYDANTDAVDAILNTFEGKWQSSDGARNGYLKGRYSAKVSIQVTGRFGGRWAVNDDVASMVDMADGTLKGHYGVICLADGAVIHLFRGGWYSDDGSAVGKLEGIGLNGNFYGIWHNTEGKPTGYLAGQYGENRFRGVWGNISEEPRGNLWGRYGQRTVVEREMLQISEEIELRTTSGDVQLRMSN